MQQTEATTGTPTGLARRNYEGLRAMQSNGLQVTPGSPVLLLADRTPTTQRLAQDLQTYCQLRVEQLAGAPSAEDFERHPQARVIIAAPATLSALLPTLASSVLRWRHLFFLMERDHLLEAASFARWADGFIFPENGPHVCDALALAADGIAVLPPYMTAEFSLDQIRIDQLSMLEQIELKVLACLGCGLPNAAIGERLGLTQTNVKSVVRSLLGKLHFRNRTEAGVFARLASDSVARAKSARDGANLRRQAIGTPEI